MGAWTGSTGCAARGVTYTGGATVVGPLVMTTRGAAACTGSTGAPTGSAGTVVGSTGRGAACTGSTGTPTGSTGAWTGSTGCAARGVTYTGGATVVGPVVTTTR